MNTLDWHGCYDDGWTGLITPEAFAHPAKYARGLIERIMRHGLEQGYWQAGDVLGDPFGGVALGGVVAAYHGLAWVGVELEERFVALGNENIDLHRQKLEALGAPIPRLLQGDSRNFAQICKGAAGVVTSPPFGIAQEGGGIRTSGVVHQKDGRVHKLRNDGYQREKQGSSPGQIANLPPGDLKGVVTSPPYEGAETADANSKRQADAGYWSKSTNKKLTGSYSVADYGATDGQIGADAGDSYWRAMALVYAQCLQALKPGGVMAVVVKRYVKNKAIVELSDQTLQLLTHVGFQPVERVRAMLVKEHTTSGLFGEIKTTKARKSFFRRLAESHGSPPIDWEDVLFVKKSPHQK